MYLSWFQRSFACAITLTPEILWQLKRVSGGTVSPDGHYLLYSQRTFDMAANKGNTDLFVVDLRTNKSKQLTETPFSEYEAQWGINNTIWFMSTEKMECKSIQWKQMEARKHNVRLSKTSN